MTVNIDHLDTTYEAQMTHINPYTAVAIAEGFEEAEDQDQLLEAWQHLIDTGLAWRLQGYFGRNAARLIEQGFCTAPK